MKKSVLFTTAACCALMVPAVASAQDETIVVEETAVVTEVPCKTHYYVNKTDNWFIQFGAGFAAPFMEGTDSKGEHHAHLSLNYNVGFGKWFSPYMGWRLAFNGGPLHWNHEGHMNKANYVGANLDFMWDMFNSLGGVNEKRVFSLIPFVGLGGTYTWDYRPNNANILTDGGKQKHNSWTLPVSGGLQARFRLCKYVDFFAEARASFYGDNFNNIAWGRPVDINVTLNGGFTITFGGREYQQYNPCDYLGYIDNLNNQVNDLRGALGTTAAALAAAEAQLPCPEVPEVVPVEEGPAPLMATVRFSLNSSRISSMEMVNVYNISEWMKANPDQNVAIVGYADRDTGTSTYNMGLSQRRAEAVRNALVNDYGINPDRLSISAQGSEVQPYDVNNWNRIVIFNVAQ
ncbi:MAG: OmpA family protein [Muribaculaceae bacterium]|nr:OmpA family protein [Muribaculaceae bacterium]